MNEWWNMRWLRRHAVFAPFGVLIVTWLLTLLAGAYQWNERENLLIATTMVDLGIVAYATGIMVGEGVSNLVFYALEQRKRRLERNRRQAQAEILSKLWQEAQDNEALKSVVERVSKEAGMVIVDNKIVFGDKEQ